MRLRSASDMADEPRLTYEEFLVLAQLLGLAMDEPRLPELYAEVEPMYQRIDLLRGVDHGPDAPLQAPEAVPEG